jgi:hypothetical protein
MFDTQLNLILFLTFIINLVGSLAYSVRIAGVRTGRIAVSFSLFNILVLISRTANAFQSPLLAKRVEENLVAGATTGGLADFRYLLLSASLGTVVGALLTPTFQRLFTRAIGSFNVHRSLPRLLLRCFSTGGMISIRDALSIPAAKNVAQLPASARNSFPIVLINTVATSIWAVGVFASIYAGYLAPNLRATSTNLSGVINGFATILLFLVVDPQLSSITDDVVHQNTPESQLRQVVIWLLLSRLIGTLLAQVLLLPAAALIAFIAHAL